MIPLAVTGGVAEGKSTVVGFLRSLGVSTLSADEIVAGLWQSSYVLETVCAVLGLPDGADKPTIRKAMLQDPNGRREVNKIFHPLVWEKISASQAFAVEVPLLIETCLHTRFDRVWVVTCGPKDQLKRLTSRVGDEQIARSLIASQLSTRTKLAFADEVIRTNSDLSSVEALVVDAFARHKVRF